MTDETGNADVLDAIGDAPGTDDTPADHVRDTGAVPWADQHADDAPVTPRQIALRPLSG